MTIDTDALNDPKILRAAWRTAAAKLARSDMTMFMRFMMPGADDELTGYQLTPQGQLFCEIIQDVALGKRKRMAVSVPPQHGKTIHLSTYGPAWIWGRDPNARIVVATYNEDRAAELGDDFLAVVNSPLFQMVFPEFQLSKSSKSKTAMRTTFGGKLFFVGQGSGTTGKTADYFIIDDPIKDDVQVQSEDFRDKLWKWFFSVAYSRGSNKTRMIVLHTRWHEDDLIGRLCDKNHPERDKLYAGIADDWEYLNIPGVIKDPKLAGLLGLDLVRQTNPKIIEQFGEEPMVALWEEDKNLLHFAEWKRGEKQSFGALVMGEPSPDDGDYFLKEWMKEYDPGDLPANLRFYGASDHAVSTKAKRDFTVLGDVGMDDSGDIWVLPELVWRRMDTKQTVDELITMFRRRQHMSWWMEDELISKSFGPFLRERLIAERIYPVIRGARPSADKQTRARAIQGRMSMGTVHFPRFASWWEEAKAQMLRFPNGANDDFVDFLSHIGNGLNTMITADGAEALKTDNVIQVGSPVWVLRQAKMRALKDTQRSAVNGW